MAEQFPSTPRAKDQPSTQPPSLDIDDDGNGTGLGDIPTISAIDEYRKGIIVAASIGITIILAGAGWLLLGQGSDHTAAAASAAPVVAPSAIPTTTSRAATQAGAGTAVPSSTSLRPRVLASTASSRPIPNTDRCELRYTFTLADVRAPYGIRIHFTGPASNNDTQVGAANPLFYQDGVFTIFAPGLIGGGEYTAEVILLGPYTDKPEGPTLARTSC